MSDLRDQIHRSSDDQVFLEYHNNSPWAKAKVAAGLRLAPEAVAYMKRELAESARAQAEFEAKMAKEKADAQQATETPAAEPDAERDTRAAVIRRSEQPETPGG